MTHTMRLTCGLLMLLAAGCLEPQDQRPGLWLTGDVVAGPVEDWSFTQDYREIFIETRTSYLIRHSVTIVCATLNGQLYVGARNPADKRWVAHVLRNPNVRLKIGDKLYERRLERVEDADEYEAVYRAYATKYGRNVAPQSDRPELWYFRTVDRTKAPG